MIVSVILTAQPGTEDEALKRSSNCVLAQSGSKPELIVSETRSAGLREAKGEFIAFLTAGDVMSADLIGMLVEPLQRGEAELAVCDASYSFGRIARPTLFQSGLNLKDTPLGLEGLQPISELYKRFVEEEPTGLMRMGAVLFPKALFDGLAFPEERHFSELFVLPELLQRCKTAYCVSKPLLTVYAESNDFSDLFPSAGHLRDYYDAHIHKIVSSYKSGYRDCSYGLDRRIFESLSSLWLPKLNIFGVPNPSSEQELYRRREWYDAQHWIIQNGRTTFELLREEL